MSDLTLPQHPEVFVIGDTAAAQDAQGHPLPGLAPVAKQQGAFVAECIAARLAGRSSGPFRYRNLGSLATIGRGHAVANFGWLRLSGRIAWLLWGLIHIAFLIGFRNRVVVLLDWLWAYVTFKRGARLITDAPLPDQVTRTAVSAPLICPGPPPPAGTADPSHGGGIESPTRGGAVR
jgi:NADH dehydrogenase